MIPQEAGREGVSAEVAFNACDIPPAGWWCSRAAGHDGPCAARPQPENANKAGGLWYRRWHAAMMEINRLNEALSRAGKSK